MSSISGDDIKVLTCFDFHLAKRRVQSKDKCSTLPVFAWLAIVIHSFLRLYSSSSVSSSLGLYGEPLVNQLRLHFFIHFQLASKPLAYLLPVGFLI